MMRDRAETPVPLVSPSDSVVLSNKASPAGNANRTSSQSRPNRKKASGSSASPERSVATNRQPGKGAASGGSANRSQGRIALKRGQNGAPVAVRSSAQRSQQRTNPQRSSQRAANPKVGARHKNARQAKSNRAPGGATPPVASATRRSDPATDRTSVAKQSSKTGARTKNVNTGKGSPKGNVASKSSSQPTGRAANQGKAQRPGVSRTSGNRRQALAGVNVTGATAAETHRVQPGESFSSISMSYYGSEKYARFLIASNPAIGDPRSLQIGAVIQIPSLPSSTTPARLAAVSPPAAAKGAAKTYRVRSGDSFYAIARDVLGDASRWNELFNLNKDLVGGDARKLKVGQVLRLPSK